MGYTYQSNPDGSGSYRDNQSGKVYPYDGGKTAPRNKTQAKQQMLQDQATMRKAAEARPKTPKPTREQMIISKPRSEKLASVEHIGREQASAETSADNRIAHLTRQLQSAKTDADKAKAQRRIEAVEFAKQKGAANQARRDARQQQLDDPRLQSTIDRATGIYQDLLMRTDVDEMIVTEARKSLVELHHSRDYVAYENRERELEQRFAHQQATKVETLKATLAVTRQEVKGLTTTPGITPEPQEGDA